MAKIKIQESDLVVGQPLAWTLYELDDQLILEEGYILKSDSQKEFLLSMDLYRHPTEKEIKETKELEEEIAKEKSSSEIVPEISLLDTFESIRSLLRDTIEKIFNKVAMNYNQAFIGLAKDVQNLCLDNTDPALAALILDQDAAYVELHPVLCAILTEMLAKRIKIPDQDRLSCIAAALTQNVGMWHEQDILSNQTTPPTDKQKEVIRKHPGKSCDMLRAVGIKDKVWLDTIMSHHERVDGQGYPQGLIGDAIPETARILALADIFSAMILPRRYRDSLYVKKALRDIFMQRGGTVDEKLAIVLIKEIGIYPPGVFVMLNNGEIAIVLKRNSRQADCPFVLGIISPRGDPYDVPRKRDTGEKQFFAIKKIVSRPKSLKINPDRIWKISTSSWSGQDLSGYSSISTKL